jgi:hypothetical protein
MQRREFIGLIGATALSIPRPGYAQTKTGMPLVGFLLVQKLETSVAKDRITVLRKGLQEFTSYWRWKSRPRSGRPTVPAEIRRLIREMSIANPLWGAPRIHGELLKLGIEIGQTSVAKYTARRSGPPSQGWKTFLRNQAAGIAGNQEWPFFDGARAKSRLSTAFCAARPPA